MANRRNGTLYTGVTSDLVKRVPEHRQGIKAGSRKKKLALIEALNPDWRDPFDDIV